MNKCALWFALLLIGLPLIFPSTSKAGGIAVADAVSHMYESMGLEKTVQQLETALQQLELVQKYTDTIESTYEKAHTNYSRAKGVYDDLMAVKTFYDKTKASWMGRYEKYKGFYDAVSNPDKAIEDFEDLLDDAFVDPRSIDPDKWKSLMNRQFDLRQLALKELLDKSEKTTQGMGARVEKAQELARSIDSTNSEKDAADLNNRLLLEILLVLQDMLALDAQYQQSMAALKYDGVSEQAIKARQDKLKEVTQRLEDHRRFEELLIESVGVEENDSILEIINKATGL
ncbi:hypothetical protein GO013_13205 [Pseudodesulfovibrio sp. JC047]|uniref:hypothetical protein n=1 Tax=Pseudodesulfovibrio sp. JC047 TaxID=2683199 RepID=UPI0013D2CB5D|nr:hypothetical protein [Pseudodesulfovibrio sp. JC047]NDV20368.1 hypothetical protein [Pseudodesulfovibrio sp. JC047]